MENDNRVRLQKAMATAGLCSRRKAEELIAEGRVLVNGVTAKIGDSVVPKVDKIVVDDKTVVQDSGNVYIMLNKPRGYVTTAQDESGRPTVLELVTEVNKRVYPVGRLDMYSEGLLILTNDGDLTYKLTHPSHNIYKEYALWLIAEETEKPWETLAQPMKIDGYQIAPAQVRLIHKTPRGFLVSIKIREGRNRQIRNMCLQCGYKVENLKRVAVGDLELSGLASGKWRSLTQNEIEYLKGI